MKDLFRVDGDDLIDFSQRKILNDIFKSGLGPPVHQSVTGGMRQKVLPN